MAATHDGPVVLLTLKLWSESRESGITQETGRRLRLVEMSYKTADGVSSTCAVHFLPVHC
jgi:hypothetical protein